MSFFRIKTVKTKSGKTLSYLYRQTSVRDGQKVRSIMEYFGSINGKDIQESTKNRNSDLEATRNPKRMDFNDEHLTDCSRPTRPRSIGSRHLTRRGLRMPRRARPPG